MNITVEPGPTATWVQRGQDGRTTTSYNGLWDSGLIEGGTDGTCSFTFEEMSMVGTVTVRGGSASFRECLGHGQRLCERRSPDAVGHGRSPLALVAALLLAGSGLVSFAVLRPQGFIAFIFAGRGRSAPLPSPLLPAWNERIARSAPRSSF